ncbi:hypothetical protein, partial [Acinetobacter baumannii]|uniref:hypothetical protein n=1 Tax=Acinetobacter baumannii TaxID=470 RepID=UPI001178A7FB
MTASSHHGDAEETSQNEKEVETKGKGMTTVASTYFQERVQIPDADNVRYSEIQARRLVEVLVDFFVLFLINKVHFIMFCCIYCLKN